MIKQYRLFTNSDAKAQCVSQVVRNAMNQEGFIEDEQNFNLGIPTFQVCVGCFSCYCCPFRGVLGPLVKIVSCSYKNLVVGSLRGISLGGNFNNPAAF